MSPTARAAEGILEARRQAFAAQARGMSSAARIQRALEIAGGTNFSMFSWNSEEYLASSLELSGLIQPDDVPTLLKELAQGDAGLEQMQAQILKQAVYGVAARSGMMEVLDGLETGDHETRRGVLGAFVSEAMKRDPFEAIELLKRPEFRELGNDYATGTVFAAAAQVDPERAFRLARESGTLQDQSGRLNQVISAVAQHKGMAEALRMADRIPEDGLRFEAQNQVFTQGAMWSTERRDEVLAYLERNKDISPALKYEAFNDVLQNWSHQDPEWALGYVMENEKAFGSADQWQSQLQGVMHQYAQHNPEKALEKLLTLTPEQRQGSYGQVINTLAERDVEKAQEAVRKLRPEEQENAHQQMISGWSSRAPEAAAAYVEALPPGEARGTSMNALMESWAQIDQVGASEWLAAQPATTERDPSVQTLVYRVQQEDPEAAAFWALQITEGDRRYNSVSGVVADWAQKKPDLARGWVHGQATVLGEENTAKLLETINSASK